MSRLVLTVMSSEVKLEVGRVPNRPGVTQCGRCRGNVPLVFQQASSALIRECRVQPYSSLPLPKTFGHRARAAPYAAAAKGFTRCVRISRIYPPFRQVRGGLDSREHESDPTDIETLASADVLLLNVA
jgi:hypothetical protein